MKKKSWFLIALLAALLWACDKESGPDTSGEIVLSSETFLAETYYLYGYVFEESEMTRYPYAGETVPDIINEGYRVQVEGEMRSLPGFSSPTPVNGFALLGEFTGAEEARGYYEDYTEVEAGLSFHIISDTVRLHQVWLQKTPAGKYAKLLVTGITQSEIGSGTASNEVSLDFTYQPDGSSTFPH